MQQKYNQRRELWGWSTSNCSQFDEALQDPVPPAQDEENEVSHFPFQFSDDTLFYDSEGEEEMEPLDKLDPLCLKTEDVVEIM